MIIKFIYTYNTWLFKKILEIRRIQKRLKVKLDIYGTNSANDWIQRLNKSEDKECNLFRE